MNKMLLNIEHQLAFNTGKNFFHEEAIRSLEFTPETLAVIERIGAVDSDTENMLIDYLTNRVLQEFCKVNQYYTFNTKAQKDLRDIYVGLFANIRNPCANRHLTAKKHYTLLKNWLMKANSFAEKIYIQKDKFVDPIACHEYSADLQLNILQIDMDNISGPVLDIGCGKQGNLVRHLRAKGIDAYGCDRFIEPGPFFTRSDWFEFEFGIEKWGTIISNLGFSNQFNHHHLREDGHYIEYATRYLEILRSLKIGGSFYYAPNLPFIENYLDDKTYQLRIHSIGNSDFKSIRIKRLY